MSVCAPPPGQSVLLASKLRPPRVGRDWVPRPHLVARLNQGLGSRLILVSAPAGYGKTTLLCQWLEECALPSTWLSLDEGDDHLTLFLEYVVAAIQKVFPSACGELLGLLHSVVETPLRVLVTTLANEVEALPSDFVFVLDDCGYLHDSRILELLSELARRPPGPLHMVLAARQDPPLPLGSLRGTGGLTEIRAAELRFTPEEVASFMQQTGMALGEQEVLSLARRTEGWVAGLRLAAHSLRAAEDPKGMVADFAGSDQYVMDYLLNEVLLRLPASAQEYLLKTAILHGLCSPLCEAVAGPSRPDFIDGQSLLEWLDRSNLFVVPLDRERRWYRYHHLFRDLLLYRLGAQYSKDEIAALHRRATDWLDGHGLVDEAVRHALDAGDSSLAADLVERHRQELADREQWQQLERWVGSFSRETVEQRPGLLMAKAWILSHQFRLRETRLVLDQVEKLLAADTSRVYPDEAQLRGEIDALLAQHCYYRGDGERCLFHAERALGSLAPGPSQARGMALLYEAGALRLQGDASGAARLLRESLKEGGLDGGGIAPTRVLAGLVTFDLLACELRGAAQTAARMLTLSQDRGLSDCGSWAHLFLGWANYQWNNLGKARDHFTAVCQRPYEVRRLVAKECFYGLALAQQAEGMVAEAWSTLDSLMDFLLACGESKMIAEARRFQARLALIVGEARGLDPSLAEIQAVPPPKNLSLVYELPHLALVRGLLVQGTEENLSRATALLTEMHELAASAGNTWRLVEILALCALLCEIQGDSEAAVETSGRAVSLAAPGGLIRVFVDLGPPMAHLLGRLASQLGGGDLHLERIMAAFPQPVSTSRAATVRPSVEATAGADICFTNRELDVLPLLAERLSNKEIAQRLFISPLTVKRHVANICDKLQVHSRREAARKARALGLLPPP